MENKLFTHSEKYAVVKMLIFIMEADSIIHPNEIEYIDSVFIDLAITADDNEHLDFMDLHMCIDIIKKMPKKKQLVAKDMLYRMANIDGYIDPREKELLDSL